MPHLTIRIDEALAERIRAELTDGRRQSDVVRAAIRRGLRGDGRDPVRGGRKVAGK